MGAGIAKQARDRFPGLDQALGAATRAAGSPYGLARLSALALGQARRVPDQGQLDEGLEPCTYRVFRPRAARLVRGAPHSSRPCQHAGCRSQKFTTRGGVTAARASA